MKRNLSDIHPQRSDFSSLFGSGDVPGLLSDEDMYEAIPEICRLLPNSGTLVEVGCFLGKSTVEWARNFNATHKNFKIISIDSFNSPIEILVDLLQEAEFDVPSANNQLDMFKHYTKAWPNIKPVKAFFNEKFVFPSTVTCVFEDSTHEQAYLAHALPFWWHHIESGGILCGHDYDDSEVQTAVDIFAVLNDIEVESFDNSNLWYIRK